MAFPDFANIVIIGAGIHGLSSAWRWAEIAHEKGNEIKLYFCEQNTSEEKRIEGERKIIAELDPLWNNKDVERTRHVDSD